MAHIESSGTIITCNSPSTSPSQHLPKFGPEGQTQPVTESTSVCESINVEEKACPDSAVPKLMTEGEDDDVLFIFSAPRSKKQQRRRYVKRNPFLNHLLIMLKVGITSNTACL